MTAVRISLQRLLHHQCQTWKALAHIRVAAGKPHLHAAWNRDHRRSRTSRMRPKASVSISLSTRRRRPRPSSIVTTLVFLRGRDGGVVSTGSGPGKPATTSTGMNCGVGGADIWQSCLRHRNVIHMRILLAFIGYDRPSKQTTPFQRRQQIVISLPASQPFACDPLSLLQLSPQKGGDYFSRQKRRTYLLPCILINLPPEKLAAIGSFLADDFSPLDVCVLVDEQGTTFPDVLDVHPAGFLKISCKKARL